MTNYRIVKFTEDKEIFIVMYANGNVIARMSLGEWSKLISLPGNVVTVG